jgi:hypothetical protein
MNTNESGKFTMPDAKLIIISFCGNSAFAEKKGAGEFARNKNIEKIARFFIRESKSRIARKIKPEFGGAK